MPRGRRIHLPKKKKTVQVVSFFNQHLLNFNSKLGNYNLNIRNVESDGNCLFRAIADQIDGDQNDHLIYRALAVSEIENNKQFYQEFLFDDVNLYIKEMSKSGIWGGHLELQALSESLQIPIIVHEINQIVVIGKQSDIKLLTCFEVFKLKIRRILVKLKVLKNTYLAQPGGIKFINIAFHQGPNIVEHYTSIRLKNDQFLKKAQFIPIDLIQNMMADNRQQYTSLQEM